MRIDPNMFNLASELEEVDRVRKYNKLVELTAQDAISFIPAHLGVVRARVKALAKRKTKWGLEILEDEDDKNTVVMIEDALRIVVPKEHWDIFQEMFVGDLRNDAYLNLKSLLNEAIEDELKDLRSDLKPALVEMFNEQRFNSLDKTIKVWQGRFGINRIITNKSRVAVASEPDRKGKDIQKLYGQLLRTYGEDKGGLEMMLADMKSARPLGAYDVLKKYDYLYGSRATSEFLDVELIFEATIDMAFMVSESIYVGDEAVLDAIEDEIATVKRVGNVLYPANERFDVGFFGTLYDIIEEVEEEGKSGESEESRPE